MFCKRCGSKMEHIMSFSVGQSAEYFRCPKCLAVSKKYPIRFAENKARKQDDVDVTKWRNKKKGDD